MPTRPMIPAHHPFVKAVARSLRRRCGVGPLDRPGTRLIVAVSGGADSVALLRAVAALAVRRRWRMEPAVGHIQHHLRPEAEGDAGFVAELAGRLGLPFVRADVDPSVSQGNLEADARRARYAALADMADRLDARYVVTAHHGDDQLETVLMRLLRGSSVRGLSAMAWRRRLLPDRPTVLIRPMLAVDRGMVTRFLDDLGQPWQHDHTNDDVSRLRARLRRDVLPVLRDIRPDAPAQAVSQADHLRQISRWLDTTIGQAESTVTTEGVTDQRPGDPMLSISEIDRERARALPGGPVLLTGVLRGVLGRLDVDSDKLGNRALGPIVRAIRDTQGGQRRFELSGGVHVVVDRQTVRIQKQS